MKNNLFTGIKPFVAKNEPEILLGMGISGFIFSTVWGVKATSKAVRKLDLLREELGRDNLTVKEVVRETWRLYLPVALSLSLSVPCVISSNRVSNRRNAALAAAFSISEKTLYEYQEKTKEVVGNKKEQEIHEAVSADRVKTPFSRCRLCRHHAGIYPCGAGDSDGRLSVQGRLIILYIAIFHLNYHFI